MSAKWMGILLIVFGIIAIALPPLGTLAIELTLGWILIVAGITEIAHAFRGGHSFSYLVFGIITLLTGGMMVFNPLKGVLTLTVLLIAWCLVRGITMILYAYRTGQRRGVQILGGLLSLLLGVLIWAHWPSSAAWAIGLLVGINMLSAGWLLIALSSAAKEPAA
jgi:uncharacterized membrane protein HdeD (DUF308 family)